MTQAQRETLERMIERRSSTQVTGGFFTGWGDGRAESAALRAALASLNAAVRTWTPLTRCPAIHPSTGLQCEEMVGNHRKHGTGMHWWGSVSWPPDPAPQERPAPDVEARAAVQREWAERPAPVAAPAPELADAVRLLTALAEASTTILQIYGPQNDYNQPYQGYWSRLKQAADAALAYEPAPPASRAESLPVGGDAKCGSGHVWSNQFGDDWTPNEGTPCDCGLKTWADSPNPHNLHPTDWCDGSGTLCVGCPACRETVVAPPVAARDPETMTDDELIEEVRASGRDPNVVAEETRALLTRTVEKFKAWKEDGTKEHPWIRSGPYHGPEHTGMPFPTEPEQVPAPPVAAPAAVETLPFQLRVADWMEACFGAAISGDITERNHRFLEEALELVQSGGCTASEAHQLVDYVYSRPEGKAAQEVGGVMVTLAALCLARALDMEAAGETELARVWQKIAVIREKQAGKPKLSPLPAAVETPETPRTTPAEAAAGLRWVLVKHESADFEERYEAAMEHMRKTCDFHRDMSLRFSDAYQVEKQKRRAAEVALAPLVVPVSPVVAKNCGMACEEADDDCARPCVYPVDHAGRHHCKNHADAPAPPERPAPVAGAWPADYIGRAFVDGAAWWQFHKHGATAWASERDEMEAEAVRRYGAPALTAVETPETVMRDGLDAIAQWLDYGEQTHDPIYGGKRGGGGSGHRGYYAQGGWAYDALQRLADALTASPETAPEER